MTRTQRIAGFIALLLLIVPAPVRADYLEVRNNATLKDAPNGNATILARPEIGAHLKLLQTEQVSGYYHAQVIPMGTTGWIYRTLVRRHSGASPLETAATALYGPLTIASFNVQFLGNSNLRDNEALADLLKDYDIVVIQELVSPPFPGTFPDGTQLHPDGEAADFFLAMESHGFEYRLSEEDTGTGEKNHKNGSATEWWVSFYNPASVDIADDLPGGFLAEDRSHNPDYDRVPYAFPFRAKDNTLDFVLVSVHLHPDAGSTNAARRKHELRAIADWVHDHDSVEKDFLILGDMNIEDADELAEATPPGFVSLNTDCVATNTNVNGPKPYDHVMYRPDDTGDEIDQSFGFKVVDLIDAMRPPWTGTAPYPGGPPYGHDEFRKYYSDHDPVVIRLAGGAAGDDD